MDEDNYLVNTFDIISEDLAYVYHNEKIKEMIEKVPEVLFWHQKIKQAHPGIDELFVENASLFSVALKHFNAEMVQFFLEKHSPLSHYDIGSFFIQAYYEPHDKNLTYIKEILFSYLTQEDLEKVNQSLDTLMGSIWNKDVPYIQKEINLICEKKQLEKLISSQNTSIHNLKL